MVVLEIGRSGIPLREIELSPVKAGEFVRAQRKRFLTLHAMLAFAVVLQCFSMVSRYLTSKPHPQSFLGPYVPVVYGVVIPLIFVSLVAMIHFNLATLKNIRIQYTIVPNGLRMQVHSQGRFQPLCPAVDRQFAWSSTVFDIEDIEDPALVVPVEGRFKLPAKCFETREQRDVFTFWANAAQLGV
jgi:hypothetical protein